MSALEAAASAAGEESQDLTLKLRREVEELQEAKASGERRLAAETETREASEKEAEELRIRVSALEAAASAAGEESQDLTLKLRSEVEELQEAKVLAER